MTLPEVKHKQPCKECPFRRVAPAGWLGGGTVDEWIADIKFGDTAFVCHMAKKRNQNHFCAGSMIHYRNQFKRPRDAAFGAATDHYARDPKKVFEWPHEFDQHHRSGLLALSMKEATKR